MKSKNETQLNLLEEKSEPIEIIECKDIEEFLLILEEIYQGKRKVCDAIRRGNLL